MTHRDRRGFLAAGALLAAGASISAMSADDSGQRAATDHLRMMNTLPPDAPTVTMLVYPQMVAQDLIGPLTIFRIARFNTQLVWKDRQPLATDVGIPFAATQTFADSTPNPDVLFVPGGIMGTIACMRDPDVLAYLAERGARAKWVTSVCTGGIVLAAAGLLHGYNATAHWAVADLLPLIGCASCGSARRHRPQPDDWRRRDRRRRFRFDAGVRDEGRGACEAGSIDDRILASAAISKRHADRSRSGPNSGVARSP
ncbi:DJ-1/PfpI family protein [Burkholderia sp. 567]|uniref:DJ-1/PfpI family protein n=1 Tax=Burkholderia sp. 567 TaxID=3156413 RepID=UPI00339A7471